MAKNFLLNAERLELIDKYKAEKLNDPPKNISDKTLIENFGTDEQKARLQGTQPGEAQEGAQNKATSQPNGDQQGKEPLEGENPLNGDENKSDEDALADLIGDAPAAPAAPAAPIKDANYMAAFNEYLKLHNGQAPASNLETAEIEALNKAVLDEANLQKQKAAVVAASKPISNKGPERVDLIHKETKEKIRVTRFAYDNYIKKTQPEFQLMPTPPIEAIGK